MSVSTCLTISSGRNRPGAGTGQQGESTVYFPATAFILLVEHYQGPYWPQNDGYAAKGGELKQ